MTKAARIMQKLASGQPRSELRTAREAVMTAAAFDRKFREAMEADKLKPEDSRVVICYLDNSLTMLFTEPYFPGKEDQLTDKLSKTCGVMAGLLFMIIDRENKGEIVISAKAFLHTKLVLEALKQRLEEEPVGMN